MKKKLFKNYTFEFDKNEKKLVSNFCKQAVKQMYGQENFFKDINAFESIIEKLNNGDDDIKFTKDEKTRLVLQLKNNRTNLSDRLKKSSFIKKWILNSMYNQYNNLIENHFND